MHEQMRSLLEIALRDTSNLQIQSSNRRSNLSTRVPCGPLAPYDNRSMAMAMAMAMAIGNAGRVP
jgi:hypothetical protein